MNMLNKLRSLYLTNYAISFTLGFITAFFLSLIIVFTCCQSIASIQYIKPCKECDGTVEGYKSFIDGYIYEECKTCEMVNVHECD